MFCYIAPPGDRLIGRYFLSSMGSTARLPGAGSDSLLPKYSLGTGQEHILCRWLLGSESPKGKEQARAISEKEKFPAELEKFQKTTTKINEGLEHLLCVAAMFGAI